MLLGVWYGVASLGRIEIGDMGGIGTLSIEISVLARRGRREILRMMLHVAVVRGTESLRAEGPAALASARKVLCG